MSTAPTSRTELMLALEAGEGAADRLDAVLAAIPVASVVLVAPSGRSLVAADIIEPLAVARKRGVVLLIADDAQLARTVRADGVHLGVSDKPMEGLETARAIVGGRAVVGADAGRSRHDAMTFGEMNADYVAFGVPAFVKDRETAFERQLDLIAWWAEIFEVPCVAMDVASVDQAAVLADAGADFVCLTLSAGATLAECVGLAREFLAAVGQPAGDGSHDGLPV